MATYCIICGKQATGIPVRNDHVLDALAPVQEKGDKE